MRIEQIEVFHLALPLRRPMVPADRPVECLETVLVRMAGGGCSGWGEASPGNGPLGGPEWSAGAFGCLRDWMIPAVTGQSFDSGDALQERLATFRGNMHAKSALDAAWWDLKARQEGKPLAALFEPDRERIELGASFDQMDNPETFLSAVGGAFEAGCARVELKFRPGWDIEMLRAVRQTFGSETIHVDIEGALSLDYTELLYRLDDFMLAMVEQPLSADDLVGHAMLQEQIQTPICLDESITSTETAAMALELQSAKYMNIRPGRVGGITPSITIHDLCHDGCVPCYVGATPQTSIGLRGCMALASKKNFVYPADYPVPEEWFVEDIAEPPAVARDATDGKLKASLWSEPGLGVEPDAGLLEKYTVQRARS